MSDQSFNEYLLDAFLARGVKLSKAEAALVKESATIIWDLFSELVGLAAKTDWSHGSPETRLARLETLRKQATQILAEGYDDISVLHAENMVSLANKELVWLGDTFNTALGIDIVDVSLKPNVLKALASNVMIQGAPSADWWEQQSKNLAHKFMTEMRMGVMQGETNDELIGRIRGTKANAYADGLMNIGRKQAEALVRTSVMQVTDNVRMETFDQNQDIIKGYMSHATLDLRTTAICRAYDGATYDLEYNPTGATKLPYRATPRHWNCRSIHVPILVSYEELAARYGGDVKYAKQIDKMSKSTRSSMDGQVPSTMTYSEWLEKKNAHDPEAVKEMLGPTRYKLWSSGKLSLGNMIDSKGNEIPVEDL